MKTILLVLIVFTTLSNVALCRSLFMPKIVTVNPTNNVGHDITVKTSFVTNGMGKPVRFEARVVTVSLPIIKSDRHLDKVWLVFASPNGGLSAPLEVEKNKGVAEVSFSIGITHLKAAKISASYSNDKNDSVDVSYLIQLEPFIQKDEEQGRAHQSTTRSESKSK